MSKSVFGGAHSRLVELLAATRKAENLTQAEVGKRVGKDQTYVSLIERSQRRVDVLEFVALARALGRNPEQMFAELLQRLPESFDI